MSGKTPKLLGSRSLSTAVKELRQRVDDAEESYRREKQLRLTLQGQLDDALKDLDTATMNSKRLENLVVKLNSKRRAQDAALEQESKVKCDREFELKTTQCRADSISKKAHLIELQNEDYTSTIENLKNKSRTDKVLQQETTKQLQETIAKLIATEELLRLSEQRAQRAEEQRNSVENRAAKLKRKNLDFQAQMDRTNLAMSETSFQLKAVKAQRDAEVEKNANLLKELNELRQELDTVSSLLIVN